VLERLQPSPIVALNRAVAVAMVHGPRQALARLDKLAATGELAGYHLFHATRADLLRRLGLSADAMANYSRALALVSNESERRFLERRLREMQALNAP
jgi:RNA polymerase sigma-70 factor (ECF subfamily)